MKKLILSSVFVSSTVFGMNLEGFMLNQTKKNSTPAYKKIKFIKVTSAKIKQKDKHAARMQKTTSNDSIYATPKNIENPNPISTQQNIYNTFPLQNNPYNNTVYNGVQNQWLPHYFCPIFDKRNSQFMSTPFYNKAPQNSHIPIKRPFQDDDNLSLKRKRSENSDLRKYIDQKYEEADQRIKDAEIEIDNLEKEYKRELDEKDAEISEIKAQCKTEINKKEHYKREIIRLTKELSYSNRALTEERKISDQLKKENELQDSILWTERYWQNIVNPLIASSTNNKNLRKYVLLLMRNVTASSIIDRFKPFEEVAQQLIVEPDISEHFQKLKNNNYFWTPSDLNRGRLIFRKASEYNKELLKNITDRNNNAKTQLEKLSKDNIALINIIRKLHKNEKVADYVSKIVRCDHPELFLAVVKCLNQNDFGENY